MLLLEQDSGGYTASGEVPEAEAVHVTSERMLRAEVDKLIRQLDLGCEWTARIQALLRLEGLVKGGAAAVPGCMELLARLQAPIIAQLLDRCRADAFCPSMSAPNLLQALESNNAQAGCSNLTISTTAPLDRLTKNASLCVRPA